MILLSISPFIFIQCGSGVHFDGRRFYVRDWPIILAGMLR